MISTTQLVRMALGPLSVGIEMDRVLGIERAERMKPAPDRPDLAGRLTNRAGEWPVIDLSERLGVTRDPDRRAGQIVLTAITGERHGLLVDRTAPVPRLHADAVRPLPRSVARRDAWFDGVLVVDGTPLLRLNPDRLASTVDLFAPEVEPPAPALRRMPARVDRMVVLGQYEYPLPGSRVVGFGLSVGCVAEMIEAPPGTPVPGATSHVRELSVWRGRALPLVDLAAWCGLPVPPAPNRRVAVVRTPAGEPYGLPAGHGVRIVPLPLPSMPVRRAITLRADRILGVYDTNEQTIVVPDLKRLAIGE